MMFEEVKRQNDTFDELINKVIKEEWLMFDKVEGLQGRAPCQDNQKSFYIMRYAQHRAFGENVIKSYYLDLVQAKDSGRNLIFEKYANMMAKTDPTYYVQNLAGVLPQQTPMKQKLIRTIAAQLNQQQQQLFEMYPKLATRGRVLEDGNGKTSSMTYLVGELGTYSMKTLRLCVEAVEQQSNLLKSIYENTASFYGQDLEQYRLSSEVAS